LLQHASRIWEPDTTRAGQWSVDMGRWACNNKTPLRKKRNRSPTRLIRMTIVGRLGLFRCGAAQRMLVVASRGTAHTPRDWPQARETGVRAFMRLSKAVQGPPTATVTVTVCKRHVPLYFKEPGLQLPCRNRPWPTHGGLSPSYPFDCFVRPRPLRFPFPLPPALPLFPLPSSSLHAETPWDL
jgi:hypothetical protein